MPKIERSPPQHSLEQSRNAKYVKNLPHYFNLLLTLQTQQKHFHTDHAKQWGFSVIPHHVSFWSTPGYLQQLRAVLLRDSSQRSEANQPVE